MRRHAYKADRPISLVPSAAVIKVVMEGEPHLIMCAPCPHHSIAARNYCFRCRLQSHGDIVLRAVRAREKVLYVSPARCTTQNANQ